MDVAELVRTLGPLLDGALIATDFDGTLSWLTIDPEDSRAVPGAVDALHRLVGAGARVAVITGRDARTVVRLGALGSVPGLTVAGMYGIETWTGDELTTPDVPDSVSSLRARLPGVLADAGADPAVWIEDKRLSLVVHARKADDPDRALAGVADAVTSLADELGLETHPGSQVLELRVPGFDKAGALQRLVDDASPTAVLWLGDDLGDLPAFDEVRAMRDRGVAAWGVGVLSSGADGIADAADVTVADPPAAVDLLTRLAG
ncbi:trehalose-phosphatase [Jatrophihabitans endophyticus]|uniref:trehalose-phosphatase n=1 Tax=Jatrophihabitans endophyticus TaxID=1206085 RepID=UPI001A03EF78|nr:trehalose-phosphatase [Jatrophihabitans endophyticus]MBE7188445.1 trehalose-phosphatase [Jatrophihabitans endophyticus]